MTQRTFYYRSGRIVAFGRTLLAIFFLLSLWLDPAPSVRWATELYIFLAWYTSLSAAYLVATWNDWWLESRLGGPAHAIDLIVFAFLAFLGGGYSNPFFIFSVFLVLSATIRWGWREATLTAILIALLFVVAALIAAHGSPTSGIQPLIIPGAHLIILSIIIIGFGMNQQLISSRIVRLSELDLKAEDERPPIRHILEFTGAQFPAARILLAWWETEEPWTNIEIFSKNVHDRFQFNPKEISFLIDPEIADAPFLFDLPRQRILLSKDDRKALLSRNSPINTAITKKFNIKEGMRIPVRADPFEGEIIILQDSGLSANDLDLGKRIGIEISGAFAQTALFLATEEAAATRERLSFARDLHDSVVQFLAGISMQLEGIKKSSKTKNGIDLQIDALQKDLWQEQRDLRNFITTLRGGRGPFQLGNLSQYLQNLSTRLARQWDVRCDLKTNPPFIEAPIRLRQDVELLVREAIANAVRHGGASKLLVEAEMGDSQLVLTISDNGKGFPLHGEFTDAEQKKHKIGPWSLRERVNKRGGNLFISSSETGARLVITVPAGGIVQ